MKANAPTLRPLPLGERARIRAIQAARTRQSANRKEPAETTNIETKERRRPACNLPLSMVRKSRRETRRGNPKGWP